MIMIIKINKDFAEKVANFQVTSFTYIKFVDHDNCYIASTHPEAKIEFFQNKLYFSRKALTERHNILSSKFNSNNKWIASLISNYKGSINLYKDLIKVTQCNSIFAKYNLYNWLHLSKIINDRLIFCAITTLSDDPYSFYINNYNKIISLIAQFEVLYKDIIASAKPSYIQTLENKKHTLLSYRELECMYYFTRYHSAKDIAQKLNISYRTVQAHIQNVKKKLGIYRKHELMRYMTNLR